MKRLLTAFIIALAIHGLMLGMTFKRFPRHRVEVVRERPVAVTFTYYEPPEKVEKTSPPQPKERLPEKKRISPPKQVKPRKPKKKPVPQVEPLPPPPVKVESDSIEPEPQIESPPAAVPTRSSLTKEPAAPIVDATEADNSVGAPAAMVPAVRKARPLYRQNPPPRYPRTARRRGYTGVVVLEVNVLKDGTVGNLRVVDSSGFKVLDKAAIQSVRKWLFEPGTQNGRKVDMRVRVPIRFQIE